MGQYYKEHYDENVIINNITLPCPCQVEVSGGGKIIVSHNGIKEQTGWKEKQVTIKGRLEGEDEEDLENQIKSILSLSKVEDSLSIISKECAIYGISKIVMENNPQITAIDGYHLSRSLTITGIEDLEAEDTEDLRQSRLESIFNIVSHKIKPVLKTVSYNSKQSLEELSTRVFGRKDLWKVLEVENSERLNHFTENQEIDITVPDLSSKSQEHILTERDSYASLSIQYFGTAMYKGKIKKANASKSLISGEPITIPPLLSHEEKTFAEKMTFCSKSTKGGISC